MSLKPQQKSAQIQKSDNLDNHTDNLQNTDEALIYLSCKDGYQHGQTQSHTSNISKVNP